VLKERRAFKDFSHFSAQQLWKRKQSFPLGKPQGTGGLKDFLFFLNSDCDWAHAKKASMNLRRALSAVVLTFGLAAASLSAQNEPKSADQSWRTSSEQSGPGTLPTRTTETHRASDGKVTDTQSIQRLGADGRYEPFVDTEKESVKVDATTTRNVVRTYGRDPDGRRKLVQVTEETVQGSPNGESKVSRTTSNPDVNGGLQVVQREQAATKRTGPNSQETTTTVLAPDLNGRFVPMMQVKEQQTKTSDSVTEVRKSTLLPDPNGKWQVSEVREGRLQTAGKDITKSEQVSRPDSEGRLSVVQKTVSKDSEGLDGNKRQTVENYTNQVPGKADDTGLRLSQRVITTTRSGADGTANTQQQVEQSDPSGSNNGMQVTQQTIDIIRPGLSGGSREQQQTVARDVNGNPTVVSIDIRQSSNPPTTATPASADNKPAKPK
jgi:hypothetical protein